MNRAIYKQHGLNLAINGVSTGEKGSMSHRPMMRTASNFRRQPNSARGNEQDIQQTVNI